MNIAGVDLKLVGDDPFYEQVKEEIEKNYQLDTIPFEPGDVVLDIGAHVGIVSLYIAKRYPGVIVHAFEPVPENFKRLKEHVRINRARRVHPHDLAVTADGRKQTFVRGEYHSGGATAFHDNERDAFCVRSTTVPRIIKEHRISRIRLLKLDCEGAEHEILAHSDEWLHRVGHIRGEIHQVGGAQGAEYFTDPVPDVIWMYA